MGKAVVKQSKPDTDEDTGLPTTFWAHAKDALGEEEEIKILFSKVSERLREERISDDTLEMMLIERVAFLYVRIRYEETVNPFSATKEYKEIVQLWSSLTTELQKFRKNYQEAYRVKEQVMGLVQDALVKAVEALPPESRSDFSKTLVHELEASGL